ncbi:MAG: Gfo/Idh/MocA family oxidoreductase [Candidatus Poribacteria bacterium]|nr:Gfo/Idh/MocA family oxidoreductase [Candidatus Poribacteria bacterium]
MAKTYRIGVIGFAHMHVTWFVDQFSALENVEWVACADTVPTTPSLSDSSTTRTANVRHAQSKGVPKVYDDYREMLEKEELDLVIACPENSRHGEIVEAIAAAGVNILTEKPPAASYDEALRMARAAELEGVELIINWPSTWSPAWRLIKKMVDNGDIGDVFQYKWRAGSMGPLSSLTDKEKSREWWHRASDGGGVLLDYCCYGACISRWLLGESAVAVTGIAGNFASQYGDADDNAALLVRYPKAMTILESTWSTVNHGVSSTSIVYGTKGTIAVERGGIRLFKDNGAGDLITPDPLPDHEGNAAKAIIHHFETGAALHPTITPEINLDAMAILDAGIRSTKSGKMELCRTRNW